ncbi:hypothetical protein ONK43_23015 [Salmonella enterica subsp. enterica serovar Virginia]|uniref:Uncharacterized protein n=1 Tax=Salmonella phage Shemara TaxID=2596714 RepID=A0A5B8RQV8_9CAUD|nr:hypothetical protein PF624_gp53 [Salmonella phage Shemara]EDQ2321218.1 hypothetical protein [Salmonella enterica subsp. enterica]MEA6258005.1 hypothetical protein [Salmonella enterica subsp. enterica serovar Virginia]MEA7619076.1 hypothetical protein [Salmonella enterica subsp. enterica serovar Virginia]MEA7939742.1 hypothetical protein [Salmonella enterica subsp. enterica serovar Virginia]MEA8048075.1 hypothetical protein [Salmonella enterica subsp. enterica serovar Virginia]
MKLHEMEGLLKGKCIPADMLVNESLAEYFIRKNKEKDFLIQQLADVANFMVDFDEGLRVPQSAFDKARKLTNRTK